MSDRTGLLIIRAWREEGASEPLRASVRIVSDVSDVSDDAERTTTFTRPEAVCATVRQWLDECTGSASAGNALQEAVHQGQDRP